MRKLGFGAGLAVGVAFMACGSKPALVVLDMAAGIADQGELVVDIAAARDGAPAMDAAVEALLGALDLAQVDAQGAGGTVVTAACDKVTVVNYGAQSFTYYFAEVETGKLPTSQAPTVVMCDRVNVPTWGDYGSYCTSAATGCSGYAVPRPMCRQMVGGDYAGTKLIIFCGQKFLGGTETSDYFQSVAVYLP